MSSKESNKKTITSAASILNSLIYTKKRITKPSKQNNLPKKPLHAPNFSNLFVPKNQAKKIDYYSLLPPGLQKPRVKRIEEPDETIEVRFSRTPELISNNSTECILCGQRLKQKEIQQN
jgi:hypothetical protein